MFRCVLPLTSLAASALFSLVCACSGWDEYKGMFSGKNIETPINENPARTLDDGVVWDGLVSNAVHGLGKDKDGNAASSITFFGGGDPRLTFSIKATSSRVSQRVLEVGSSSEKLGGAFLEVEGSMVLVGQAGEGGVSKESVEGTDLSLDFTMSNELVITLGDPDPNDMFHVEVRRDAVFGSPVYVLSSGQSMCAYEEGTLARDMPELLVRTPMFTHVNPNSAVSTTLQLLNKSPTGTEREKKSQPQRNNGEQSYAPSSAILSRLALRFIFYLVLLM